MDSIFAHSVPDEVKHKFYIRSYLKLSILM